MSQLWLFKQLSETDAVGEAITSDETKSGCNSDSGVNYNDVSKPTFYIHL